MVDEVAIGKYFSEYVSQRAKELDIANSSDIDIFVLRN